MTRKLAIALALLGLLAVPATVVAHDKFDHGVPPQSLDSGPTPVFTQGGDRGVEWEPVTTLFTGNPHSDLDFFEQDGEIFASVGTLGTGGNAGGQTIAQLTEGGEVEDANGEPNPTVISGTSSAACGSNPLATTGLQHDVEATPKADTILNTDVPGASRRDTQLIIDATDADGRCHDQGMEFGVANAPQGGLEIVDVTDPTDPVEIGLISHAAEAHTVNVDPRRPHIVYAVTSSLVAVDEETGQRQNEVEGSGDELELDGFEVADISSCLERPLGDLRRGTDPMTKREECRPEVFRYRYPSADIALGHTLENGIYGCHELEVYPEDLLTCGGGNAMMLFDISRAFNDQGTPNRFTDDTLRGEPLPCRSRPSTSSAPFTTGARVEDCVIGKRLQRQGGERADLSIPGWIELGSPSLRGIRHLGSAHHQGRGAGGAATPAFPSNRDIDFDHEAEFSHSRDFIFATDERGGGVTPPGATCVNSPADLRAGNGGIHAYAVDRLDTELPESPREAFEAYARRPNGKKAIYRAPIRTGAESTFCTAHVFQQIPGQNRIFMGWYSQGTQVLDYTEFDDGTIRIRESGFYIPEEANEWASHIFKMEENADGSFTYWGAASDFRLTDSGRSAIDIYTVTMPAPQAAGETEPPPVAGGPTCKGEQATVEREPGEPIVGTQGDDVMVGTSRDDEIRGRGGDDLICARAGDDDLRGGRGDDRIFAGGGDDVVDGGGGDDRIIGAPGADTLLGASGSDRIAGRAGPDRIKGGSGPDKLIGNAEDDVIRGNRGRDVLRGKRGDDRLFGGAGVDRCAGGAGTDTLRSCER